MAFLERHRQGGVAFCYRIVRDSHVAEDLFQDACVRLQERSLRNPGGPGMQALLFTTLKNLAISYLRRRARKNVSLEKLNDATEPEARRGGLEDVRMRTADEQFGHQEIRRNLGMALDGLETRLKKALLLKEVHGKSYQEIAREMKLSVSNVGVLIFRAREQLREKLRRHL